MKRFFILATAAIVALASCAKTEVVYKDAPEKITFKQVADVMTKADPEYLTTDLGVYAYQGSTKHFENFKFVEGTGANDNIWANDDAYWPYEGALDFVVYAPHSLNASYESNKLTVTAVTAEDKLYYGAKKYTGVEKRAGVPVSLKHMSSKITVNFSADDPYEITKVTLNGVTSKGSVEVNYTNADSPVVTATSSEYKDLEFANGGVYYILPGNQTYFTIEFTQGNLEFIKKIDLAGTDVTWDANTAYTYNITLTASDKITFSATVAPWDEEAAVNKNQSDLTDM